MICRLYRVFRRDEQGFALVIIMALFTAFALIAMAVIDHANATQQLVQQQSTRTKLSRISYALVQYSLNNSSKYPCPADPAIPYTGPTFGASVAAAGPCTIGGGVTVLVGSTDNNLIQGMVPVQSLIPYGINPDDAIDSWNNKIMYVVNRQYTNGTGSTGAAANPVGPNIAENNTGESFQIPDFIILSYGRDGLGAYPKNDANIRIACPAVGTLRKINCGGTLTFAQGPIMTAPSATVNQYFDDLLSFYGR